MRHPNIVTVDPDRRELRFGIGAAMLGGVVMICGWPAFYGVLWFAAHAAEWAR